MSFIGHSLTIMADIKGPNLVNMSLHDQWLLKKVCKENDTLKISLFIHDIVQSGCMDKEFWYVDNRELLYDGTPLHTVVKIQNMLATELLLQYGANTELLDRDHDTALIEACRSMNLPMVSLLLEFKANPNTTGDYGKTPLMHACAVYDKFRNNMVEMLLTNGADANIRDKFGKTAIDYAVKQNCWDSMILLLEHSAKISKEFWSSLERNANMSSETIDQLKKKYDNESNLL